MGRPKTIVTPETVTQILEMRADGLLLREITARFDWSISKTHDIANGYYHYEHWAKVRRALAEGTHIRRKGGFDYGEEGNEKGNG